MADANKLPKPTPAQAEEWMQFAEKAAKEQDPAKLMKTVEELCRKLDEREAMLKGRKPPSAAKP
ncbi:MAG TPA: hypothetical protein VGS27_34095 [Candidatus Sulfotelmatobacter sp.]|nr:hypothetical protein [Candidatus Sulfotelmatobacter sp.]